MPKHARSAQWTRQDRLPSLEEIAWLASAEGRAVCAEMASTGDADTPAAISRWRERLEPDLVAAASQQIRLRIAAQSKFSRAGEMLFDRVGLEQATDETIAAWKARRFAGIQHVADLCCGIGGDALALAAHSQVTAVDWSELKLALARHNATVYGRTLQGLATDVATARPEADAIHVDPDRRATGARRHDPQHGSPDLVELQRIVEHYGHAAIKFSPGIAFDSLPFDAEVELISHQGECRQAVAWTGSLMTTHRRATVLPAGETIEAGREISLDWPSPGTVQPGDWLLEPDAAVIRSNLVGVLAGQHALAPIDPQVAWLTGARAPQTALLRAYRIIDSREWSLARARTWLASHDVGRLDIKTRSFAGAPEEILRRLHLAGSQSRVLFLTRLGQRPTAILAERR